MKFLQVTTETGKTILLNVAHITEIHQRENEESTIYIGSGESESCYKVKEKFDFIFSLFEEWGHL